MLRMTPTSASELSKVLLVADARPASPAGEREARIRRYRLARLRLDGRASVVDRHAHLRRSHD